MTTNDQNINLDNRLNVLITKIEAMEQAAKDKEAKLGKIAWHTNCQPKNANFKSLHVATTPDIVDFVSFLFSNKEARQKALKALGLSVNDVEEKYDGYLISEWIADAKQRVTLNEIKAMKDKIKVSYAKIETLKSETQKRNDGISSLEQEFDL